LGRREVGPPGLQGLRGNARARVLHGVASFVLVRWYGKAPNPDRIQETHMHAHFSPAGQYGLRTWILVAVVFALLALIGILWDEHDLGDGLVLGSDATVSGVWERPSTYADAHDFLFGTPSAEPAPTGAHTR
jgi:hypothetical protein